MKKIGIILFLAFALWSAGAYGQDGRQRTTETVVADCLAQLPATTQEVFTATMRDLAATGSEGVKSLAGLLVPAAEGQNAATEYALSGLVAYATAPTTDAGVLENVRRGLVASLPGCGDKANRAFLLTLLGQCGSAAEASAVAAYAEDDYLSGYAVRALSSMPGTDAVLLELASKARTAELKRNLCNAYAQKGMTAAEDTLLGWLASADKELVKPLYTAMAACGGAASEKVLAAAAKKQNYADDATGATECYLRLLARRVGENPAAVAKSAKGLLKCENTMVRGEALRLLIAAQGAEKSFGDISTAVRKGPAEVRHAALDALGADMYGRLVSLLKSCDAAGRAQVLRYLGDRKAECARTAVAGYVASPDAETAAAAVDAAGRLGGEECLAALGGALATPQRDAAMRALKSFPGDIAELVGELLKSDAAEIRTAGLQLAAARRVKCADRVFALLEDPATTAAAYAALPYVVGNGDSDRLSALLDKTAADRVATVQQALIASLRGEAAEKRYDRVAAYMKNAPDAARYYAVLGWTGADAAVDTLTAAADRGDKSAFTALLDAENARMPEVLYGLAERRAEYADAAIGRYGELAGRVEPKDKRVPYYAKGLAAKVSAATKAQLLRGLGDTHALSGLALAAPYLDDAATSTAAAAAVKTIAAKHAGEGGPDVVAALEKARAVYAELAKSDADAGYAVDEITGLLAKYAAIERYELSAEEAGEGFEVLFDGLSLDKWTGNKTNYIPKDGTIYVTAQYGGSGNLYTEKEYGNFVLRFEFAFDREGVNNGIGIRTPMGVDAAYHGMEIQVLDHDAPMYKNLKKHQQHGSVYGIIAAKRVVFPERGTWNVEEIRAEGDHITVTVNGEVILDGNIREACQGHNVAPDGGKENPYTVDHRNHPGLFNESGHIGLLGHGPGIMFRNIRVKELPATPAASKRKRR